MKNLSLPGSVTAVNGNVTAILISGKSSDKFDMTSAQILPLSSGLDVNPPVLPVFTDALKTRDNSTENLSTDDASFRNELLDSSSATIHRVRKMGQFLKMAPANQADNRRLPVVKLIKSRNKSSSECDDHQTTVVAKLPPLLSIINQEKSSESNVDMRIDMPVLSPEVSEDSSIANGGERSPEDTTVTGFKKTARKTFPTIPHETVQLELNFSEHEHSSSSAPENEEGPSASSEPERCQSPDADVVVIDGIEFRSFGTKRELEDFCARSTSRTLNVHKFLLTQRHHIGSVDCSLDMDEDDDDDVYEELEEWGYRGYNSEGESSDDQGPPRYGKRIVPTKTTDITKIKGWKNKLFSSNSDHVHRGKFQLVTSADVTLSPKPEDNGVARGAFVSEALDEFLMTKSQLNTANLVTTAMQSSAAVRNQGTTKVGKPASYPKVGEDFQELMITTTISHERAVKATLALIPYLVLSKKEKGEIRLVENIPPTTGSTSSPGTPGNTDNLKSVISKSQIEPPLIYHPPKQNSPMDSCKRNESCLVSVECALKAVEALVQPDKVQQPTTAKEDKRANPVPLQEARRVVDIPQITTATINNVNGCTQEFCQLGCICDSLKTRKRHRKHCGQPQCMFSCRCDGFPPLPTKTRGKLLAEGISDYEEDPPAKRRRQIRLPARLKDSAYVWTAGRDLVENMIDVDEDHRDRKRPSLFRAISGKLPGRGRPRLHFPQVMTSTSQQNVHRNVSCRGRAGRGHRLVRLLPYKQLPNEPVMATNALADARGSQVMDNSKREGSTAELAMNVILVDTEVEKTRTAFLCTKAGNVCAEFSVDSCTDCVLEWEIGPPRPPKPETVSTSKMPLPKNVFVPISAALQNNRVTTMTSGSSSTSSKRARPLTVQQQLTQQRLMKAAQMAASAGACVSGNDGKYLFVTGSGELLPCVVVPVEPKAGSGRLLSPTMSAKAPQASREYQKPSTYNKGKAPSDMLSAALNDALQRAKILQAARRNQAITGTAVSATSTVAVAETTPRPQVAQNQNGTESDSDSSSSCEDSEWSDTADEMSSSLLNKVAGRDEPGAAEDGNNQSASEIKSNLERIRRQEIAKSFMKLCHHLKTSLGSHSFYCHKPPSKVFVLTAATKHIQFLQEREKKLITFKKSLIARRMKLFNSYTSLLKGLGGSQQRVAVKSLIRRLQECCRDRRRPQVNSSEPNMLHHSLLKVNNTHIDHTADDSSYSNSPELLQRLVATNNLEVIPIIPNEPGAQKLSCLSPKTPCEGVSMATVTPIVTPVTPKENQKMIAGSDSPNNAEDVNSNGTNSQQWPKIVAFMSISEAEFLSKENEMSPLKSS